MALIYGPRQEKGLRLKLPASLLYSLRVIGRGSVNDLILRILREYRPDSKSRGYGRDTISQLDKLYFLYYPYPPKTLQKIKLTRRSADSLWCVQFVYMN